ncbi:MAG: FecR domain-containing protein [Candidatus Tantalella remota]|nr:FecR domain-containing protein [Candidatus Tantalella remota]
MKYFLMIAVCVSVVLVLGAAICAAEQTVFVVSYAGEVKLVSAEKEEAVTCVPGMVLTEGTRIITGEESYIMLAFDRSKNNLVKVKENSEVILKLGDEDTIELIDGKMFTLLRDLDKSQTFRIRTPDAVCGARGTGWGVTAGGRTTSVAVFDKKVFVTGINKDGSVKESEVWVEAGYQRSVKRYSLPGEIKQVSEEQIDSMKREFGLLPEDLPARGQKASMIDREDQLREEQMESIRERRDEREERTVIDERRERDDLRTDRANVKDRTDNRPLPPRQRLKSISR